MALPLVLLGASAAIAALTGLVKVASDEAEDTATKTIPAAASSLATLAVIGLGAYAAYRVVTKGRL